MPLTAATDTVSIKIQFAVSAGQAQSRCVFSGVLIMRNCSRIGRRHSKNSHELAILHIKKKKHSPVLNILSVPTESNPSLYAVGDSSDFCKLTGNWSFKHGSAIQQVGWYFRVTHTLRMLSARGINHSKTQCLSDDKIG